MRDALSIMCEMLGALKGHTCLTSGIEVDVCGRPIDPEADYFWGNLSGGGIVAWRVDGPQPKPMIMHPATRAFLKRDICPF